MSIVDFGKRLFTQDELRAAYHRLRGMPVSLTLRAWFAWCLLRCLVLFYDLDRLREGALRGPQCLVGFDAAQLHLRMNRIHDLPDVVVTDHRPPTVNILVPAFSVETISAGFFGVFAFARFVADCGFRARLVLFDNFAFYEDQFREALARTPGLVDLLDKVELTYIGSRHKPLTVSSRDVAVASVWYSAYFAEKIRAACGAENFLYLVQDYEAGFHPQNAIFALAHESYALPAVPFFSTQPLRDHFTALGLYGGQEWRDWCVFNNAYSRAPNVHERIRQRSQSVERRFVYYSRPGVDRNMFELGALALIEAYRRGIFDNGANWRFFGMGIGNVEIHLDAATKLTQLPRMSLAEYAEALPNFDVGLSLMASAHPSLTPMDLAGSGVPVVTNSFGVKDARYFAGISENIVCVKPTLEDLVEGLRRAVARSEDFAAREAGATINFPSDWDATWTLRHRAFLTETLGRLMDRRPSASDDAPSGAHTASSGIAKFANA